MESHVEFSSDEFSMDVAISNIDTFSGTINASILLSHCNSFFCYLNEIYPADTVASEADQSHSEMNSDDSLMEFENHNCNTSSGIFFNTYCLEYLYCTA